MTSSTFAWLTLAASVLAEVLGTLALRYAVWAGCGTALTVLVGIAWYGEAATWLRLCGLALIVLGVVALNLGSPH